MNLIEAFQAAKSGKRVMFNGRVAIFAGESLRWVHDGEPGNYVTVDDSLLFGWELAPLVTYDFEKALSMMKDGFWMRPINSSAWYRKSPKDGKWELLMQSGDGDTRHACVTIYTHWFDSKWEARS